MCVHLCMEQKETTIHQSKLRHGPFKINLHPRDYFQGNPYRSDRPLPPAQKPLPPGQKVPPVPFKPPSPSKKVTIPLSAVLHLDYREVFDWMTCHMFVLYSILLYSLCVCADVSCVRLEEWKQGRLTLIPHTLLTRTSFAVPNQPINSQFSVLFLVLRVHLSRASSPSMLTGGSLSLSSDPHLLCSHMEGSQVLLVTTWTSQWLLLIYRKVPNLRRPHFTWHF